MTTPRRRPATGLTADLQNRYANACTRALPAATRRRYIGWTPTDWARRYAHREPHVEEALGGICWNYPDRAIVCATMMLLDSLAGPDFIDPDGQRRALAKGFRNIADMIEQDNR